MHWKEKVLGSWKIVLDVIVFDVTSTILGLVFLLSLFYFIYLFIYLFFLSIKKAPKCKTNNFHPLKKFCAPKKLLLLLFFVRLILLVGFGLICIFYAQNLFVKKQKKKNQQTRNCPDNLKRNIINVNSYWSCYIGRMVKLIAQNNELKVVANNLFNTYIWSSYEDFAFLVKL